MEKGEKRIWVNAEMHKNYPQFYPKVGTIGVATGEGSRIQWPKGSTSGRDCWSGLSGSKTYVPWWKRLFKKIGGKA